MLNKIQPTTFLEISSEFMIDSKVILKRINSPDDTWQGNLKARLTNQGVRVEGVYDSLSSFRHSNYTAKWYLSTAT